MRRDFVRGREGCVEACDSLESKRKVERALVHQACRDMGAC